MEAAKFVLQSSYPAAVLTNEEEFRLVEAAEKVQRAADCFIEFYASPAGLARAKQAGRAIYVEQRLDQIAVAASKLEVALDGLLKDARLSRARGHPKQAWQLKKVARILDATLQGDAVPEEGHTTSSVGRKHTVGDIWAKARSTFDEVFATDPAAKGDLEERLWLRVRLKKLKSPDRLRFAAITARNMLGSSELLRRAKTGGGQRPTNVAVAGFLKQLAEIYVMLWRTPPSAKIYATSTGQQNSRNLNFVMTCFSELVRVSGGIVTASDIPSASTVKKWSKAKH